jgi:hypothetical protein
LPFKPYGKLENVFTDDLWRIIKPLLSKEKPLMFSRAHPDEEFSSSIVGVVIEFLIFILLASVIPL